MFQSSKLRIRGLLDLVDEMLADPPEPVAPHPHRRPVTLRVQRRSGAVPAKPMHCLCPVRPPAERARDQVR